jgi:hypothetical protein
VLAAALCSAQLSTLTQVNGAVTDASGAIVPGATVTALNTDTQVQTPAQTNTDGTFVITGLPPGTYRSSNHHRGGVESRIV